MHTHTHVRTHDRTHARTRTRTSTQTQSMHSCTHTHLSSCLSLLPASSCFTLSMGMGALAGGLEEAMRQEASASTITFVLPGEPPFKVPSLPASLNRGRERTSLEGGKGGGRKEGNEVLGLQHSYRHATHCRGGRCAEGSRASHRMTTAPSQRQHSR